MLQCHFIEGLKSSIKHKNKLFVKQIKHKNNYNECVYKKYRNKLPIFLRQAEKQCYDNLFTTHKDNLNKTWKTNKLIINKHKNVAKALTFVIITKQVTDPKEIADKFNNLLILVLIWPIKFLLKIKIQYLILISR